MELTEPIGVLNARLKEYFGTVWDGRPAYRIVFSDDQREKRFGTWNDYGPHNIFIRSVTEWREVPKYQYLNGIYVLEQLFAVPEMNQHELAVKTNYEPLFSFMDKNQFPLPPKWEVCEYVIRYIRAVRDEAEQWKFRAKYVDPYIDDPERGERELAEIYEYLYGNETSVTDSLSLKEGIVVPNNYQTTKES